MWLCDACGRHVLPVVKVCPFCATVRVAKLGGAVVAPLVLSACYGAPPCEPDEVIDSDQDGYSVATSFCWLNAIEDCDDSNAAVFPGAEEICDDGIDNNCDGISAGAGQREACNGLDDDCDGEIDEDNACGTNTGDTGGSTVGTAAVTASLTWSSLAPVANCAEAGVTTVSFSLRENLEQKPSLTRDVPCADVPIELTKLPAGSWLIEARATSDDQVRRWASAPTVIDLVADANQPVALALACSSNVPDGCGL